MLKREKTYKEEEGDGEGGKKERAEAREMERERERARVRVRERERERERDRRFGRERTGAARGAMGGEGRAIEARRCGLWSLKGRRARKTMSKRGARVDASARVSLDGCETERGEGARVTACQCAYGQ